MAISGDIRLPGSVTAHTGGAKIRGNDAPQNLAPGDKFAPGSQIEDVKAPNFTHGGEQVRGKKNKWHNQTRDAQGYGAINSAGRVGGLAAAVAVGQLQYPDGRWNIGALADKALSEKGFPTEFPANVLAEVAAIPGPAGPELGAGKVQDLRNLSWSAIDNKTSKDIDQIEWSERLPDGSIRVLVAVTDVAALVAKGSALDEFTKQTTTSLYTPDKVYNMLPERLSTDIISLNKGEDRLATVFEYTVKADGSTANEKVFQAMVNSKAQLDYPTIGDWLEGKSGVPAGLTPDLQDQIKMQDEAAKRLAAYREKNGSLEFASNEIKVHCENGVATGIEKSTIQSSNKLVENFMVTANQVNSRFIRANNLPTIQRVVERPEKWDQIVAFGQEKGYKLPKDVNDPEAGIKLGQMMRDAKAKDPAGFSEFSTSVVKLIGRGKFVAVAPNEKPPGHFGMGITDYVQSTASMRRRADIVNARIMRAALEAQESGKPAVSPYTMAELQAEADAISAKESDSKKAERQAEKCAIATMLEKRIGETFNGVITGVKGQNVWVKVSDPPVEAKLGGGNGLKIGDKVNNIKLQSVNVPEGHIDFSRR